MKPLLLYLTLLVGYSSARPQDDLDANSVREEIHDPSQYQYAPAEYETTPPADMNYGIQQQPADSCDDYPPANCIMHFSPLPRSLHRSPFNIRSDKDFTLVCESYKKALQCVGDWVTNCRPHEPEARRFIDQMLALLGQCDNEQIRKDSIVALECGRRMGSVHERCMRETRFIPQLKNLSPERMVRGEPDSVRDLCCGMKYHKACYMDQVLDRCGQEALEANHRLETIVMQGFSCANYADSECPSIRS